MAPTQPGQDNTTFICEDCQNTTDLKSLENELSLLKKGRDSLTPSQLRRLEFLENLIKKIKAQG